MIESALLELLSPKRCCSISPTIWIQNLHARASRPDNHLVRFRSTVDATAALFGTACKRGHYSCTAAIADGVSERVAHPLH
jgi:hypothetical protein